MIERLPMPRMDYISAAPYIVTVEWPEGLISTRRFVDLGEAMQRVMSVELPMAPEPGAPDRRVVFDVRGVTIFGFVEDDMADVPHVITTEVANLMRSLGCDEQFDVLALELEMAWRQ